MITENDGGKDKKKEKTQKKVVLGIISTRKKVFLKRITNIRTACLVVCGSGRGVKLKIQTYNERE